MKKILGIAFAIVIIAGAAYSAPVNVGVVDMAKVSEGYERYSSARKDLEKKKAELQSIVDQEEQSILQLINELETVRATATQEEIGNRRSEIERRDKDLREFVIQTNMQFRDELDTLQFRTKDEVETVVIEISRKLGLDVVLERNMTLFINESLEITNMVIAELNNRYKPLPPVRMNISGNSSGATSTPPTAFPSPAPAGRSGNTGWPFTSR